jgi:hypothetical protein
MLVSSPLSRRTVLKRSGLGALALSLPTSGWLAGPASAKVAVPALRRSTWLPLVGQSVRVAGAPDLRVDGVVDLAGATRDAGLRDLDEAFVVSLSAPAGTALESGLHTLEHPEFGSAVLFVSPVGGAGDRAQFELVVDRTIRIAAALDAPQVEDVLAASAAAAATPGNVAPFAGPTRSIAARRIRVRASARRAGGKVVATLDFPGGGVQAVRVEVYRKGRRVATGSAAVKRGEATVPLRTRSHLARGRYELVLTITDRRATTTTLHRSLTLR